MYDLGGATDTGLVRATNQDNLLVTSFQEVDGRPLACLVVADGMGGHSRGEEASYTAVTSIQERLRSLTKELEYPGEAWCRDAILAAHNRLAEQLSPGEVSGTTLTVALVYGTRVFLGHVGDSRAYILRGNEVIQLTEDQTWEREAEKRGFANVGASGLLQAVGATSDLNVATDTILLEPKDTLILCSDGLHKLVPNSELVRLSTSIGSAEELCTELVKSALSKGGSDNVTVCCLRIASRASNRSRKSNKKIAVLAGLLGIVLFGMVGIWRGMQSNNDQGTPVDGSNEIALQDRRAIAHEISNLSELSEGEVVYVLVKSPRSEIPSVMVSHSMTAGLELKKQRRGNSITVPNLKPHLESDAVWVQFTRKKDTLILDSGPAQFEIYFRRRGQTTPQKAYAQGLELARPSEIDRVSWYLGNPTSGRVVAVEFKRGGT